FVVGMHVGRVPLHAPDQRTKRQPFADTARRVSDVPATNLLEHAGAHNTCPCPVVETVTEIRAGPKTALTGCAASAVTEHVGVPPVQAPCQLTKCVVRVARADSVTCAPWSHCVVQVEVQSRPGWSLSTVPAPSIATAIGN